MSHTGKAGSPNKTTFQELVNLKAGEAVIASLGFIYEPSKLVRRYDLTHSSPTCIVTSCSLISDSAGILPTGRKPTGREPRA